MTFFKLNDCLTVKKRKKRKVEWETIVLTHVAPGVRPLPLVLLVWVCPAGFQKSQRAHFRLAASLVSLAYSAAFYIRVAWAQEWS